MIFLVLLSVLFRIAASESFAQELKREKEEKIKRDQMPDKAMNILQGILKNARRERYFMETDGESRSFECKLRINRRRMSVEFTEKGSLEDVEVVITLQELPEDIRRNIRQYLEEHYNRYMVRRMQKQYSTRDPDIDPASVINAALSGVDQGLTIRYEFEVDGERDRQLVSHELTFDQRGMYIGKRIIIRRQIDNILY